jgi:tRNA-2-methylthio-N6-dimethylallyladenosine synthase
VFGTRSIDLLPQLIANVRASGLPQSALSMDGNAFVSPRPPENKAQVSGFVTIMQGCDNHCAYCVVPSVRGPEISKPPEAVLSEVQALVAAGVKEITLLGQNVNSYGQKDGLCDFPALLQMLHDVDGLARIRFTTSHPKDLSDDLIAAFRDLSKLCRHIHLPIQSGSDRILKKMNRKYTRTDYLDRIAQLRDACPDIAVTSDFIAGFPGETDADFEDTLSIIETVGYDSLFAFKYSDRPSAPASRFSEKIPEPVKTNRLHRLLDLQRRITLEKHQQLVGRVETVLVEGSAKKQSTDGPALSWSGRTGGNKIVNFTLTPSWKTEDMRPGRLIPVRIDAAFPHSLRGRPVESSSKGENNYDA